MSMAWPLTGLSALPDDITHIMPLIKNDGLICENGNTPSSSSSDECCWECTARNEEIAILKAENKTLKVEIDHLNRASNDRMVYDLFH